jgi:rod shape determining protein RodA
MREHKSIFSNIDWFLVLMYLLLVFMGWVNIYAAVYNENHQSIFDISQKYGKQLLWICSAIALALVLLTIDGKFYAAFSYPIYGALVLAQIVVYFVAPEVNGARAWIEIGDFKVQPSEFAKFATNMALAKYLSTLDIKVRDFKTKLVAGIIVFIPMAIIILQNDTGSALVFVAFILVLFREGLSGSILLFGLVAIILSILALLIDKLFLVLLVLGAAFLLYLGLRKTRKYLVTVVGVAVAAILLIFSVDFIFDEVLEPHQQKRINVLLGTETDLKGAGYNVNQSMIAIGSGGFSGKGFLNGTQTKYDFVPEQSTDFIYCTVGEEWGFIGSSVVIILFIVFLLRIIFIAERQRSDYSRIYGYGVASIIFFHLFVNVGMTIGLAPVIGIPLPFFSYGGSSLWSFTILLFIFIKLDAYRMQIMR